MVPLRSGNPAACSDLAVWHFLQHPQELHWGQASPFNSPWAQFPFNPPALDAVPVRPKEPVLIGDDPYHTEVPSFAATSAERGLVRRRTNVLDRLDLGDIEECIPLKRPSRLRGRGQSPRFNRIELN